MNGTGDGAPYTMTTAIYGAPSIYHVAAILVGVPPIPCLLMFGIIPLIELYRFTMFLTWDRWNSGRGKKEDSGSGISQVSMTFSTLVSTQVPLIPRCNLCYSTQFSMLYR